MTRRPNILLITSDQQRGDCYGFRGRRVKTPHIDRLAADGTHFSACITPNPICQPARASILTGFLPLSHGVCDNGIDLDPELGEAGFAGQLSNAGYATALIGKGHFATRNTFKPNDRPENDTGSMNYGAAWSGPYMGFQHVELSLFGHLFLGRNPKPPHGHHFERWFHSRLPEPDAVERLWAEELPPSTGAAQTWNSALPAAWHTSTWVGDRTIAWLEQHEEQNGPFCLWASFPDPHHPFDCPEPWCRLHPPDGVDLPAKRTPDFDRRPWWHRASLEGEPKLADPKMRTFRAKASRAPSQTDEQLADMTANYYGMLAMIDHNVGRILSALQDRGLAEDTIVIYTSDHGDLLGDHGLYLKGPTPYEGLINVGAVVRGPGVPAGRVVDQPVSTLDLAATFAELGGVALPDGTQSRSLLPLMEHENATRDVAYCEWNCSASRVGVALALRTVRTRTHKCTFELNSGAGELYDLVNDPDEMENRYDDPACAGVRRELEDMMRARPGPVRDPLPEPVGMA